MFTSFVFRVLKGIIGYNPSGRIMQFKGLSIVMSTESGSLTLNSQKEGKKTPLGKM
jgi:hypothetical protein